MSNICYYGYCPRCGFRHQHYSSAACPPPPPPTQQPLTCPVCAGSGRISRPAVIAGDQPTWTSNDTSLHDCHACTGTGIVWGPPQ